ncbi:alpha/beta hydrolase [Tunicatimonas pelagia]|uniref:alpha/beta hydrolase n=1 Tax=Tunicatimonas pelagia TaxID=931531 RepID=UPI002665C2CD|nr:alpha/beta hydrolase family protein [Tunicatimonas pelagia]WKN41761.1 alpha/beta hydrolase family protein [Tunicatimonas pelagia]
MNKFLISASIWFSTIGFGQAATVDTVQIFSEAMQRDIRAVVITPEAYATKEGQRFPVVYLLHGYSGNYADWISKAPDVASLADQHDVILVCPDGGFNSWYLDSPINDSSQYETHVVQEVVNFVDEQYRTLAQPTGRAITGLSMGGHGALFLAIRHTDIFGAAGSMSGGVDLTYNVDNWGIKDQLGIYEQSPLRWDSLSVVNMIPDLSSNQLALIIDCGTDDFFFRINQQLHQTLLDHQIPHNYIVRPGAHNWDYWSNAVAYQLVYFANFFEENGLAEKQTPVNGQKYGQ